MKVYNKRGFISGIFMIALGAFNLVMGIKQNDADASMIILTAALSAFGLNSVIRSLSDIMTRKDRLEEADERNCLIEMKSKSKSFKLTQSISFILMLASLVAGKISGESDFVAIGVGLAFAFVVSMFSEIFTYMYYESKN